jgi:hypothetical protein
MNEDEIRAAAAIPDKDLIMYHDSTGRMIRNEYNLWAEENPFTDSRDPNGPLHPDQFSFAIMQQVVKQCRQWVSVEVSSDG